jgi:hypothetical protein
VAEKRQILDNLQVNSEVFENSIEIRCQISMVPYKSTKEILNLELPPGYKTRQQVKSTNYK